MDFCTVPARPRRMCGAPILKFSIHAPAWGATPLRTLPPQCRTRFNSRAREGRDQLVIQSSEACPVFQFTRPRGARRFFVAAWPARYGFNSRAREGRDPHSPQR